MAYFSSLETHETNFVGALFIEGYFIKVFNVLALLYRPINLNFRLNFGLDIMLNLIGLALEIFKYCGFLDDVVGELVPLHVVVAVDIDLIEEKGEVAHEGDFTIRYVILPELEVLFGDHNKLIEFELIVP